MTAAPAGSEATRRASGEVVLGANLAFASRTACVRTALSAAGVALGVVVLLLAASIPHALSARAARVRATTPVYGAHGPLRLVASHTEFRGATITENAVQPVAGMSARAPLLPPGVTRLPAPGEMLVSPAVARLLAGPGGVELRHRLRARVVGEIGAAGLREPDDALLYRGATGLTARDVSVGNGFEPEAATVIGFGVPVGPSSPVPLFSLLIVVAVVALLLPVAVFMTTAARFGAEERERQLSAIRLVGADRRAIVRVAAGESLVGSIAGLSMGAIAFLALRPVFGQATPAGLSVFSGDIRPAPLLGLLIVVLVPVSAVVATLLSIRRVAVEPLGVSRRGAVGRRQLWWRLLVPAIGFLLLAPLVGSDRRLADAVGQIETTIGVVLVLVGVSSLLPWLTEAVVARAPDGPLPWLLAVRRLRREEGTTGRVVAAIGLTVAGAIALSIVFSAAQSEVGGRVSPVQRRTLLVVAHARTRARIDHDLHALAAVPGVVRVTESGGVCRCGGVHVFALGVITRTGARGVAARVRDRAAALDPIASVTRDGVDGSAAGVLAQLRHAVLAGAVVVLMMIGASLLVAAGDGLRERRGPLAVLGAVGVRRSTIAWSMLWQAAIPIVGGLALAVGIGVALGAVLSEVVRLTPAFDWGAIALMLLCGSAIAFAVTVLTLPTVSRMMRPGALRVE